MIKISIVVSHNLLMMTIAHGVHHFSIRLHSTSINFYAQRSEVSSLIEDFRNQAAYVSILTDVWGFIILLMGKKRKF
jgi:P pilus assembly chaperone PapD